MQDPESRLRRTGVKSTRAVRDLIDVKADLERTVRLRKKQLQLLVDISMMANGARQLDEAIAYALRRIADYNGWLFGHAYLLDEEAGEMLVPVSAYYTSDIERFAPFRKATSRLRLRRGQGLPGRVLDGGRYEWTSDIPGDLTDRRADAGIRLGLKAAFAFPILTGTRTVGVMEFFSERSDPLELSEQVPIASVGAQLGRVFERDSTRRRFIELVDHERERLSRDLHDAVGQDLAGLAMSAESIAARLESQRSDEADAVARLATGLREALEVTRQIAHRLNRMPGGPDGLRKALEELALRVSEQSSVPCSIEIEDGAAPADEETGTHLYRISQEALQNALKHAAPKHIDIALAQRPEGLVLEVRDDGAGISGSDDTGGMGLQIMRQRARLIGGHLDIERGNLGGTVVRCVIAAEGKSTIRSSGVSP